MGIYREITASEKIFIRVDSNLTISGGHLMRCLSIADALITAGKHICFLIADSNPITVLKSMEIPYIVLHSDWQDLMTDVEKVKGILEKEKNPILLIDTYRISQDYVEKLRPYCRVAYLGSKQEYLGNLNLLINYSTDIDYDFYYKNYGENTKLLLGAEFAPLRKEFQHVEAQYKGKVKRILLTTGNTDRDEIVPDILQGLLPILSVHQIAVDVVVGHMFKNKKRLHELFDSENLIFFHENVKLMSALMQKCDLAISANGTTVYELSAMGLPIISFAMVEEQVKSAEALSKLGVIDYCGKAYENKQKCVLAVGDRVKYYLEHNDELIALARKAHGLIDGNGCQRIVEALTQM